MCEARLRSGSLYAIWNSRAARGALRGVGGRLADASGSAAVARDEPLARGVALEPERDEAREEIRVGEPARLPELRVHADRGEAGDGVDLVQQHAARAALDEA